MRWLSIVLVILLAIPAYAGENEAEKLYRQMEKKLTGAKTIKVRCETTMKRERIKATSKYTLVFGENNKAYWEIEDVFGDKGAKAVTISNGTKLHFGYNGVREGPLQDSPKTVRTYGRAALARGFSYQAQIQSLSFALDADIQLPDDPWKMSNFKLGAKEKIGNAETRIIEYTYVANPEDDNMKKYPVKVWIDTQTYLPVKQEMRVAEEGGATFEVTDTFAEFIVDG